MSDGILSRWSRRKRAALTPPPVPVPEVPEVPEDALPPIDQLDTASDYTAFLQKGVAAEVQRRALALAWRTDPAIATFQGMAEYAWDFNAPRYGALWGTDNIAELVDAVIRPPPPPPIAPAKPGVQPVIAQPVIAQAEPVPVVLPAPSTEVAIVQAEQPAETAAVATRRHGSALPA